MEFNEELSQYNELMKDFKSNPNNMWYYETKPSDAPILKKLEDIERRLAIIEDCLSKFSKDLKEI